MLPDIKKAIKAIINFKKEFERTGMVLPRRDLVGEVGELYALEALQKEGLHPNRKGGQGRYDIELNNKKIEVRTSLLKNEGVYPDKTIRFWGWRVENRNQNRRHKFDFLVGVALANDLSKPKFYVFSYKEAFSVDDVYIGRFSNVKKKIHLFENKRAYRKAMKQKPALITQFERRLNSNPARFRNKWGKILK